MDPTLRAKGFSPLAHRSASIAPNTWPNRTKTSSDFDPFCGDSETVVVGCTQIFCSWPLSKSLIGEHSGSEGGGRIVSKNLEQAECGGQEVPNRIKQTASKAFLACI